MREHDSPLGARAIPVPPITGDPYSQRLEHLLASAHRRYTLEADGLEPPTESEPDGQDLRALRHRILARIEKERSLPSLPDIIQQLDRTLATADADATDIARVLSLDPGMAARVLSIVNSAFYGLRSNVTRLEQAVALLGVDAIRSLVLSTSVFDAFHRRRDEWFDPMQFWEHAVTVATGSRIIAANTTGRPEEVIDPNVAFLAGLLHDVGKILISQLFPESYKEIRSLAKKRSISLYEAELVVMGVRHTDVGHRLLATWGVPESVATAARFHHEPATSGMTTCIVHVADLISHGLGFFPDTEENIRVNPIVWEVLDLSDEAIETVAYRVLGNFEEIRALLMGD